MINASSSSPGESADPIETPERGEGEQTVPAADESELGYDQIFELLSNQRRRYVLQYLQEFDDQTTLSDLAEQIAAWENDKEPRLITSDERKRAYVGLYQGHLPKMHDVGVITYNKPRGTIESAENISDVTAYLETNDERSKRASVPYYIGVSVAIVTALTVAILLGAPTTGPNVTLVLPSTLLAFLLVTATDYRRKRQDTP